MTIAALIFLSVCREELQPVGAQSAKDMLKARAAKAKAASKKAMKKAMKKAFLKKASFRRGKKKRKVKKAAKFHEYDLVELQVPRTAWPQGPTKGVHSYTVRNGVVAIEVLCRNKAFYCKKVHPSLADDPNHRIGQVGWKTVGSVAAAWRVAKERVGWDLA